MELNSLIFFAVGCLTTRPLFVSLFGLLFFSSQVFASAVILQNQRNQKNQAVTVAVALEMPLLVKVLRAAEHGFSLTSEWKAESYGLTAYRKNTSDWFEKSNGLKIRVLWNGSYEIYCGLGTDQKLVLMADWETLLSNKSEKSDLCK